MKKRTRYLLLVSIILIAIFLRFFDLASLPAILNRDEAALAYNAYLIKEVGMDEWQVKNPFLFKSFGDYKLPVYPYFLTIFFKIFGMTDLAVRLPSAIAGTILVFLAYFWAKNIFKTKEYSALLFSFSIAVLPVFSFYSRIAFEANLALTLFIASLYFLFKEKRRLFLALALMLIAALTYNTPFLLLPFIILLIPIMTGFRNYKKWFKAVLIFTALFVFIFIKLYPISSQKSGITIFTDINVWENYALYRSALTGIKLSLFGNKYFYYLILLFKNIIFSFSPNFLILNGGSHPWHSIPGAAHIFWTVYLPAIFGIIYFLINLLKTIKEKFEKNDFLLIYFLITALAPSVITVDSPHATRSLFFFFNLLMFAIIFLERISVKIKKNYFIYLFIIFISIESIFYYQKYFLDFPKKQAESLWIEYKDLLQKAEENYGGENIAVVDSGGYQYILTAWYAKIDSEIFFKTMKFQKADRINFYYGEYLKNYHFIKNADDHLENENIIISQEKGLEQL